MKIKPKQTIRERRMRVYIDIGSHGGVFMFEGGNIAERYPTLLHVYRKRVVPELKPATLVYHVAEVRRWKESVLK